VHQLIELEVTEVVGPKGKHDPGRTAMRDGHEDGSLTLGGRRVTVPAAARPVRRRRARLDLIDEFRLLVHPVAVRGGIPFFPRDHSADMELVETRTFGSRVVYLRYRAAARWGP
jgi:hypothetical protein